MIPKAETLCSAYLREHESVVALDVNVATQLPRSFTRPWVRVIQLDAAAVGRHRSDHLIEFMLQFDCYAGAEDNSTPAANLVTRTVREALRTMPGKHEEGVVTSVEFISCPRIPDTDFEDARERYVLTALICIHP